MESHQPLSFKELFTHIIADIARSVCERPNETKQQQFVRTQVATQMILALLPRDVIEAMLAGNTVMFHALMADSIHDTLQGEMDTMRRATRSNIVAMNKAFHMNLAQLKQYQARPSEGTREASEPAPKEAARTPTPACAPRPQPARAQSAGTHPGTHPGTRPGTRPETPPPPPGAEDVMLFRPSPEQIAACRANPEAMAALDAGDAGRFARAMGIEQPSQAYLHAAAGLPARIDEQALAEHLRRAQATRSEEGR